MSYSLDRARTEGGTLVRVSRRLTLPGLNQVEIWFAKIQRDVITRDVFPSVAALSRKLMKYIRAYAKTARPFRWNYTDPSRRIKVTE